MGYCVDLWCMKCDLFEREEREKREREKWLFKYKRSMNKIK